MRTIRPALLLPGLLILASLSATAQTYFYIHSIAVEPAQPTNMDVITIALNGDLSSTGSSISDASWELAGNTVHITLTATNDIGMDILVPHTEEFVIGTLPTGTYNILVDGAFIDEFIISVIPILLGDGTRLFRDGDRPQQTLELVSSEHFTSGLVQLHYRLK